jgi:hypothetical protein
MHPLHTLQVQTALKRKDGVAAQRLGIQLPRVRRTGSPQKRNDLAREAVSCNAMLARNLDAALALNSG